MENVVVELAVGIFDRNLQPVGFRDDLMNLAVRNQTGCKRS